MTDRQLKYFITTDKYNLLKDNDNIIKYTIKKFIYRLFGYHKI
jgi:hypothetical protein